jgi:hypothetical protein
MTDSLQEQRWEIRPYEGGGVLHFGMSRSQVRSLLGPEFRAFRKGTHAATDTDAYDKLCLHLYYDAHDRLEYIEAWGSCQILYKGIPLLGVPTRSLLLQLNRIGLGSRYDDGYLFDDGGFTLYAPGDVVEAVGVYRRGYYDKG